MSVGGQSSTLNVKIKNVANDITDTIKNTISVNFGFSDTDISEISVFAQELYVALLKLDDTLKVDAALQVVAVGNKIPCHAGFVVMLMLNDIEGNEFITNSIIRLHKMHIELFNKDQASTNTSDVYETLGSLIMFSPLPVIRQFVAMHFEIALEVLAKMKKRPTVAAVLINAMSEVFLMKNDEKYIKAITSTLQDMLTYLHSYDNTIPEITNAVNITLKQVKNIVRDLMARGNKKESLKKINGLVNKKSDIGQVLYSWVMINPSCAINAICNPSFPIDLFEAFFIQLKLQHIIEFTVTFDNVIADEKNERVVMLYKYLQDSYGINNQEECMDKILEFAKKQHIDHYGLLLRNIMLMPTAFLSDGKSTFDCLQELRAKLSAIANNLSADLSQKSLSVTIAPMGRSSVYNNIIEQINRENGIVVSHTGHLAKLQEKNVIKKIKESGSSFLIVDQLCGSLMISIFELLSNQCQGAGILDINDSRIEEILTGAYKLCITKHKIIMTKVAFFMSCGFILEKIKPQPKIDDMHD